MSKIYTFLWSAVSAKFRGGAGGRISVSGYCPSQAEMIAERLVRQQEINWMKEIVDEDEIVVKVYPEGSR